MLTTIEHYSYYVLYYYYILKMVNYRSFYFLQRADHILILDSDKLVVTSEETLNKAKHFVDMVIDNTPDPLDNYTTPEH